MAIDFKGQTAVVTGAGGGLGRVYCLELARRGANIVINDYGVSLDGTQTGETSAAEELAEEIKKLNAEAVISGDNVADEQGGKNISELALEKFGQIDIVINNAGILQDSSVARMPSSSWKSVIDVHLNGAFNVTKPAFLNMKENKYGRVIFTSSAAGLYGNFGQANYSAAKMGLIGFMNSLRPEAEKYNICVNTVAPLAESRMTKELLPAELLEKMKPEYVFPLVLYLASENCKSSSGIYNVGMGLINRVEIKTFEAVNFLEENKEFLPEDIEKRFDEIHNLEKSSSYSDIGNFILDFIKETG